MTMTPMIETAMKEGREPRDIAVIQCDGCGKYSYYNEGSHASCEHCDRGLDHLLDQDSDAVTTLDDLWESQIEEQDYP